MKMIMVEKDGKTYYSAKFYLDKYALLDHDLRVARKNGLPFKDEINTRRNQLLDAIEAMPKEERTLGT